MVLVEAFALRTAAVLDDAGVRWRLTKGAALAHLDNRVSVFDARPSRASTSPVRHRTVRAFPHGGSVRADRLDHLVGRSILYTETGPTSAPPSISTDASRFRSVPARVLWVIKGLGPGGAERLLCAAARAHDREHFHIECAYVLPWKDHLAEELERAGVKTHCMSQKRTDRRWPLRLAEFVRDGEWDIVHAHSPLPGSVARAATRTMPKARRPRLVSTEHNRWATHRGPTRWLNVFTSRWDDVSFAVTDEVRESMSGPATRRVETLQHGIDVASTSAATADRDAVRSEFGIGLGEIVVGTVANFRPQKDYPNLPERRACCRIEKFRCGSWQSVRVRRKPRSVCCTGSWVWVTGWSSLAFATTWCG